MGRVCRFENPVIRENPVETSVVDVPSEFPTRVVATVGQPRGLRIIVRVIR